MPGQPSRALLSDLPVHPTSFVGREHEIGDLIGLLDRIRLLTLTGVGGVGKTRLAIQIAAKVKARYPAGVWLVELAPLADPALVDREVAASLGVREQPERPVVDSVAEYLRPRRALILLDNCEHVIAACAQLVDTLLHRCPQLQILATSREPLNVDGEMAWRVPSLTLPDLHRLPPPERVARYEAVQLFVARATSALPSFRLTEQNVPAVAQICNRVDGIPLALELAAARITVLSAEQIAARLDNLFRLLTAGSRTALPRQQTLRATVDWSFELLSAPEQRLFNRLAVFAGGWTLEAAEAIGSGEDVNSDDVLDLLAHLVVKSLVVAEEHGAAVRYRLLEPIRQYAAERLHGSGEAPLVRGRHLDWFARFAVQADQELRGPNQGSWLDRVEVEQDNLRAALDWAATRDDACETALELCSSLALFWYLRDHIPEGRERLERALASPLRPKAPRMRALAGAGWLAHFQRDQTMARAWIGESLALARELGDPHATAWALYLLGRTYYFENDSSRARALAEASLSSARGAGNQWLMAWAIHLLAIAAYLDGDYATVRDREEESLGIWREIGDEASAIIAHYWTGMAAHREEDYSRAVAEYLEVLNVTRRLGLSQYTTSVLASLAAVAAEHAQFERAVRLAAAVSRRSELVGVLPIPVVQIVLEAGLEAARRALRPEAYASAWSDGLTMGEDDAIKEALATAQVASEQLAVASRERGATEFAASLALRERRSENMAPRTGAGHPAGLTERELEILRLVAAGQSSIQIAEELVLSVRTVERHVSNIYRKLDVRTRAQATAYAHTHGLVSGA